MADRTFWKGFLKLSLVTCPVTMTPATSAREKVRFHTINKATGNRVESRYVDSDTGKFVPNEDQARGYEKGADEYVILEDDDLDQVALETTRTIDIDTFVPRDSIPWTYLDKPHFLAPSDEVGEEAFAVVREAMAKSDVVGISRLVLYRRERAVMLLPKGKGIILWTLRYGDEVREETSYFEDIGTAKPEAKLMKLATDVIADRTRKWAPALVTDPVQKALLKIIASKKTKRAKGGKAKTDDPRGDNVVDLFAALKKSLSVGGRPTRSRAKK